MTDLCTVSVRLPGYLRVRAHLGGGCGLWEGEEVSQVNEERDRNRKDSSGQNSTGLACEVSLFPRPQRSLPLRLCLPRPLFLALHVVGEAAGVMGGISGQGWERRR